ncbi:MAG: DUF4139 domain-containing protein [Planctomycetales bacterium]|nr:DUF4139 domain-containing protein [Planctomycetales bacterium]
MTKFYEPIAQWILCQIVLATIWQTELQAQPARVSGVISHVALFRDQAKVTRDLEIPASAEATTLRVIELPPSFLPGSEQITTSAGVRVLSRRLVTLTPEESQSQHDNTAEQQSANLLGSLNDQRRSLEMQLTLIAQQLATMERLLQFSAKEAGNGLQNGTLQSETVEHLSEYGLGKQNELLHQQIELSSQLEKIQLTISQTQKSIENDIEPTRYSEYQLEIQVQGLPQSRAQIWISYTVGNCSWQPYYRLYANSESSEYELKFGAAVIQETGEDWPNVALEVAGVSPNASSTIPVLVPLRASVSEFGTKMNEFDLAGRSMSLPRESMDAVEDDLNLDGNISEIELQRDVALNARASSLQSWEIETAESHLRAMASDGIEYADAQVYKVENAVSVASQPTTQMITVRDAILPGEVHYVVTPLLSSFAYREVKLLNTSDIGLIAGPVSISLDGRAVGRTMLPATASGQPLVIGLGADQQLRTRRELVDKSHEIQGGNAIETFRYRIVVANFKPDTVSLRVMDRMPQSSENEALTISIKDSLPALSEDREFHRLHSRSGILRWDVDVPARRFGESAFDILYTFTAMHDRNQSIFIDSNADRTQQDLFNHESSGMGGMGGMGGGMMGGGLF